MFGEGTMEGCDGVLWRQKPGKGAKGRGLTFSLTHVLLVKRDGVGFW